MASGAAGGAAGTWQPRLVDMERYMYGSIALRPTGNHGRWRLRVCHAPSRKVVTWSVVPHACADLRVSRETLLTLSRPASRVCSVGCGVRGGTSIALS